MLSATPTVRDRLEAVLLRIAEGGFNQSAFVRIFTKSAREAADAADARAAAGCNRGPLDGALVAIKDNYDVEGEPTLAGSASRVGAPPAAADATALRRMKDAGAVILGKTSMSEFAFSALGHNPHFGTPANPRDATRIPGGSSAGAAVSVASGLADVALGSDTGGSVRIPAAFCGVVGFKATSGRIPTDGVFPLSPTLDVVGPIAGSVAACRATDAVLSGVSPDQTRKPSKPQITVGVPTGYFFDAIDNEVDTGFAQCRRLLEKASVRIVDVDISSDIAAMLEAQAIATFSSVELYRCLDSLPDELAASMDPRIVERLRPASFVAEADYQCIRKTRDRLVSEAGKWRDMCDCFVVPTVPFVAPTFADVVPDDEFHRINQLTLRNPLFANYFDLPALSLPVPWTTLPVGLMLIGHRGDDQALLRFAAMVEALFADPHSLGVAQELA